MNDAGTETDPLPQADPLTLCRLLLEPDVSVGARILATRSPSGVELHH